MNNKTINAIEILAQKLETTSEHLWSILLKQASISAIANIIQYAIITLACYFWIKNLKVFAAKISTKEWEDLNWIWITIVTTILGLFAMAAFFSFSTTFYALVNPEYWALNRILSKLK